jgi:Fe-S cluster biogenesis protein NfuA
MMLDNQSLQRVRRVEDLLSQAESLDGPARDTAVALVRATIELYGEGLARITAVATRSGVDALVAELAADELVSHLLLLHDLHPLGVTERVARALERLGPRLHGAQAELVSFAAGVARLRVSGGSGCGSASTAVDSAIQAAVLGAAPEVERIEVDHAVPPPPVIPLETLRLRIGGGQPARTALE